MRWLPFPWRLHVHRWVYQLSGGRLMGRGVAAPILLLSTRGRRSGKTRTWPLAYLPLVAGGDSGGYVVVASNGGQARHPGGTGTSSPSRESASASAGAPRARERARLWERVVAGSPGYARYQQGTTREIPVVVLEPDAG